MQEFSEFKFQHFLSKHPEIIDQKGFYTAYKDAGVYGNYFTVKAQVIPELPTLVR